jgi:hypothetical protein
LDDESTDASDAEMPTPVMNGLRHQRNVISVCFVQGDGGKFDELLAQVTRLVVGSS